MEGLISPDAITVAARSGRDSRHGKRTAFGPQRIGLPVFLTPTVNADEYMKHALVDSDLRLLHVPDKDVLLFYGITAVTGDFTPEHAFQTIAVGGTVNVLNTSEWPVRQLDAIHVVYEKVALVLYSSVDHHDWRKAHMNPSLDFPEPCAIVCAKEYAEDPILFPNNYHHHRIGLAMSTDRSSGGKLGDHSFSLLLDEPVKRS